VSQASAARPVERVTGSATVRNPLAIARHGTGRFVLHLLTIVVGGLLMVPFAWALVGSLKPQEEIKTIPPTFLPSHWVWENYLTVWTSSYFTNWIVNTVLITVIATLGVVISASLAGYAFARMRFPGRQFFMTIPPDLDEAAKIDGAGHLGILLWVVVPLSLPVLAAAAILSFINNWNSFVFPLIILNDPPKFTLSIGLRYFQMQPAEGFPTDNLLLAGSVIMTIPIIAIFFLGQRYFVKGVVMSGLKG
jgi:multiple sugar transport system permease protein